MCWDTDVRACASQNSCSCVIVAPPGSVKMCVLGVGTDTVLPSSIQEGRTGTCVSHVPQSLSVRAQLLGLLITGLKSINRSSDRVWPRK